MRPRELLAVLAVILDRLAERVAELRPGGRGLAFELMQSQSSEELENEHPSFEMGEWWRLVAVIRGEPTKENYGWGSRDAKVYDAQPGDTGSSMMQTTANWKGYTEIFRLARDGSLTLLRFAYDDLDTPPLLVNERIKGGLYVVLKAW